METFEQDVKERVDSILAGWEGDGDEHRNLHGLWRKLLANSNAPWISMLVLGALTWVTGFALRSAIWLPWIVERYGPKDDLVGGSFMIVLLSAFVVAIIFGMTLGIPWERRQNGWFKQNYRMLGQVRRDTLRHAQTIQEHSNRKLIRRAAARQARAVESLAAGEATVTEQIEGLVCQRELGVGSISQETITELESRRREMVESAVRVALVLEKTAHVEVDSHAQRATQEALKTSAPGRIKVRHLRETDTYALLDRVAEAEAETEIRNH